MEQPTKSAILTDSDRILAQVIIAGCLEKKTFLFEQNSSAISSRAKLYKFATKVRAHRELFRDIPRLLDLIDDFQISIDYDQGREGWVMQVTRKSQSGIYKAMADQLGMEVLGAGTIDSQRRVLEALKGFNLGAQTRPEQAQRESPMTSPNAANWKSRYDALMGKQG